MDSLSPTTPVGIRTTLRGQRLLQVVHGIMYGETVLATEHIKSISVFLEKSQDWYDGAVQMEDIPLLPF
jgi:hypothetical protein